MKLKVLFRITVDKYNILNVKDSYFTAIIMTITQSYFKFIRLKTTPYSVHNFPFVYLS